MIRPLEHACLPIDIEDPLRALRALGRLPGAFLLHSALAGAGARWSFFGADPFAVFRAGEYVEAIATWRRLRNSATVGAEGAGMPFTGGAVGAWSYDFGRRLERLPSAAADDLALPDAHLAFYDVVGAFDHATRRAWLFSSGLPLEGDARATRATRRLAEFRDALAAVPSPPGDALHVELGEPVSTFDRHGYASAVERVREAIRRGDIFQANLSQRWTVRNLSGEVSPCAYAFYAALARRSPAPYAAYFDAGDHVVVSASPERFLRLRAGRVETRPIKGTRPRATDPAEDRRLAQALLSSAKDRAENVMIVDVMRNDLGRVCVTGSVRATGLCELESFPQVHHLTSTVTGQLRPQLDAVDLLHACFPAASISGAPKIRAMEILETLEPVRRHIYTGAIGYLDWSGDADWNVAIRTALVTPRSIHFSAGGAITAESDPAAEYQETLDKAAGMFAALADLSGAPSVARPIAIG